MIEFEVLAVAQKFGIQPLEVLAAANFRACLEKNWKSDSFPACIREVYAILPEEDCTMHEIVIDVVKQHIATLLRDSKFRAVVQEIGEFATDIIDSLTPAILTGCSSPTRSDTGHGMLISN